jgi:cytochrome c-type biogenesis protein CcmH/NrfF
MQAAGMSDQSIVQSFIKEYGPDIYLAPPNALGWIVPYASVGVGLLVIFAFVRKYRKPKPFPVVEGDLAKYHDEIEKDLANLE